MTKIILLLTIALTLLAGCGSDKKEIEQLRAEQERGLEQKCDLDQVRQELLSEQKKQLNQSHDQLRAEQKREIDQASADQTKVLDEMRSDLRELKNEIRLIRGDLSALNDDVFAMQGNPALTSRRADEREADDKRLEEMRDPRRTWETLGDQEELTARLDTFAKSYAESIEDPTKHDAFLADVANLKDELAARADLTPEEQLADLKARVTEQRDAETDERRRGWYERQLEMMDSGDEEHAARYLEQATRLQNGRAIGELAEKYEIPRDTLRDNGLQAFGGRMRGGN